jgi:hypothetical protein
MLSSITSAQFTEWVAFYHVERQIRAEIKEQADLEREALYGADEIRAKLT